MSILQQIGSFHSNHCEDFTITSQLGSGKRLIAVMDGCTICTDGIYTFKKFGNSREQKEEEVFKSFLFKDKEGSGQEKFLDNKLLFIRDEWKHAPSDDLPIIRLIRL